MVAFFSLVPMIGSTIIWVPAAVWLSPLATLAKRHCWSHCAAG